MTESIILSLKILGTGFAFVGAIAHASPLNGTTCEGKRIFWEDVRHGGGAAPHEDGLIMHTELKIDGKIVERMEHRYVAPAGLGLYNVQFDEASKVQQSVSGDMYSGTEIYDIDVVIDRADGGEVIPGQKTFTERVLCQRNWAALP